MLCLGHTFSACKTVMVLFPGGESCQKPFIIHKTERMEKKNITLNYENNKEVVGVDSNIDFAGLKRLVCQKLKVKEDEFDLEYISEGACSNPGEEVPIENDQDVKEAVLSTTNIYVKKLERLSPDNPRSGNVRSADKTNRPLPQPHLQTDHSRSWATKQYHPKDKVAILAGNSKYKHMPCLEAPKNDVIQLTKCLETLDFKVVSMINLTKLDLENAIRNFCENFVYIGNSVYVYAFIAGHGFEQNGIQYLCTIDSGDPAKNGAVCSEDCTSIDFILENIQRTSPCLIVVMADICRTFVVGNTCNKEKPFKPKNSNTLVCYASCAGGSSFEGKKSRRGHLAKTFGNILQSVGFDLSIGVHDLFSLLLEKFPSDQLFSGQPQIPELRTTVREGRRSFADTISPDRLTASRADKIRKYVKSKPVYPFYVEDTYIIGTLYIECKESLCNVLSVGVVLEPVDCVRKHQCEVVDLKYSPEHDQIVPGNKEVVEIDDSLCTTFEMENLQLLKGPIDLIVNILYTVKGRMTPMEVKGKFVPPPFWNETV